MMVSVVTPFYNTEAYLAEAIESVIAQTYRDFEYLLLDNCSTDGSLAVAEAYARRDSRIRVVTNDAFLAQDLNLSNGFRHIGAASRYAKMVLADDTLLPRCLEEMVRVAEAHPSAGLVGSYYLKGTALMGGGFPYPAEVLPGREVARLQLQRGYFFFGSPSSVLFRSEVVRRTFPFYDPAAPHADTEACYRTLRDWDFGFVHQVLSVLRTADASRMGMVRDYFPNSLDKLIVVRKFGRDFLDGPEYAEVERHARTRYLREIGDALLTRRDAAFWRYHREGLATIGIRLGTRTLWRYVFLALADRVFNPKKSLGRLLRRGHGRRP